MTTSIRVGKKAQIVLPAALRRELHIEEGDVLQASIDDSGRIVMTPVPPDPLDRLRWAMAGLFEGVDPVEFQRELRREDDEVP
jgi:AbrB family looped-hinge helix DNA binding protein